MPSYTSAAGYTNALPDAITDALDALATRQARAVVLCLYDYQQPISYDTLADTLADTDDDSLDMALTATTQAGLLVKRDLSDAGPRYALTTYGERFVRALFASCGSARVGPDDDRDSVAVAAADLAGATTTTPDDDLTPPST